MRSERILVVGTLDTKGYEIAFLCDRLIARGAEPVVVDSGILGKAVGRAPDVSREEVAQASGRTLQEVRDSGARGTAVEQMVEGLRQLVPALHARHGYRGAVGIGGAEGALLAANAFQTLPFGIPKLVVTPLASGVRQFGPFVGTADIAVMHSVVDLQGLNTFTARILDTAAGMVTSTGALFPDRESVGPRVAISLNGNTTTVGTQIQRSLEARGHEVVAFHSNGVGGINMERLAAAGDFGVVIDLTTNELVEEIVGGLFPVVDRLRVAGRAAVPRVVVPGCLDFVCQGAEHEIEPRFAGRPIDAHNPHISLVQVSRGEAEQVAAAFVDRLEASDGPVRVVVPTGGLSLAGSPGGAYCGLGVDGAVINALVEAAARRLPLVLVDAAINDPRTGDAVLDAFDEIMSVTASVEVG